MKIPSLIITFTLIVSGFSGDPKQKNTTSSAFIKPFFVIKSFFYRHTTQSNSATPSSKSLRQNNYSQRNSILSRPTLYPSLKDVHNLTNLSLVDTWKIGQGEHYPKVPTKSPHGSHFYTSNPRGAFPRRGYVDIVTSKSNKRLRTENCTFTLPNNPSTKIPLFITSEKKIMFPTYDLTFYVHDDDVVYADCDDTYQEYKCQNGQLRASDSSSTPIEEYLCKNNIKIFEYSNDSRLVNIGYRTKFAGNKPKFTSHIDRSVRVTYTKHILTNYGKTQPAKRDYFTDSAYLLGSNYNDKYNTANKHLTGFDPAIDSGEIFHIGHLTPRADFNLWIHQSVTYIHSNVAPQWKSFNAITWRNLEFEIRKKLEGYTATIYTGTYGNLILKNSMGIPVQLFVYPPDKIPVPLWFYKIVIVDDKCAVYLGYNYPKTIVYQNFTEETPCTDIYPGERDEKNKIFNFRKNGYILCCNITIFQNLIDNNEIRNLKCRNFLNIFP